MKSKHLPDRQNDICMVCCTSDNIAAWEDDSTMQFWSNEGDFWVYCKACDVWTAHPQEDGK